MLPFYLFSTVTIVMAMKPGELSSGSYIQLLDTKVLQYLNSSFKLSTLSLYAPNVHTIDTEHHLLLLFITGRTYVARHLIICIFCPMR